MEGSSLDEKQYGRFGWIQYWGRAQHHHHVTAAPLATALATALALALALAVVVAVVVAVAVATVSLLHHLQLLVFLIQSNSLR